jgi:hypothetical protein
LSAEAKGGYIGSLTAINTAAVAMVVSEMRIIVFSRRLPLG